MELQCEGGGPSLLNLDNVKDDMYGAENEYDGVTFVSPVMVQRCTFHPHYLYVDRCSAFNQVFTENHIL